MTIRSRLRNRNQNNPTEPLALIFVKARRWALATGGRRTWKLVGTESQPTCWALSTRLDAELSEFDASRLPGHFREQTLRVRQIIRVATIRESTEPLAVGKTWLVRSNKLVVSAGFSVRILFIGLPHDRRSRIWNCPSREWILRVSQQSFHGDSLRLSASPTLRTNIGWFVTSRLSCEPFKGCLSDEVIVPFVADRPLAIRTASRSSACRQAPAKGSTRIQSNRLVCGFVCAGVLVRPHAADHRWFRSFRRTKRAIDRRHGSAICR